MRKSARFAGKVEATGGGLKNLLGILGFSSAVTYARSAATSRPVPMTQARVQRTRAVARMAMARIPRTAATIQSRRDKETISSEPAFFVIPQICMNVRL